MSDVSLRQGILRRAGGEERELTPSCGKRQTDNGISVNQDFRFQQYSTKVVCINTWAPNSSSVNTCFVLFLCLAPFSPFETWSSSGDPVARQVSKHRVEHFPLTSHNPTRPDSRPVLLRSLKPFWAKIGSFLTPADVSDSKCTSENGALVRNGTKRLFR